MSDGIDADAVFGSAAGAFASSRNAAFTAWAISSRTAARSWSASQTTRLGSNARDAVECVDDTAVLLLAMVVLHLLRLICFRNRGPVRNKN
jgi:hypothetical protein